MGSSDWMIYGANGYTGRLIVERAVKSGLKPVLAGRSVDVITLAQQNGLESRLFDLKDPAENVRMLDGMKLVLHCAGPFSVTSRPMQDACIRAKAHYLDITGEISVFESVFARTAEFRAAGISAIPGVGFDVVPSDCLAAMLKQRLPSAIHLALAFKAGGRPSPGTAKTMIEGFAQKGAVRRAGKIVEVSPLKFFRMIDYGRGPRFSATIPWGDVSTAYYSTGIPNIEVYVPSSPWIRCAARALGPTLGVLAGQAHLQGFLKNLIGKYMSGSSTEERENTRSVLWGEVKDESGKSVQLRLKAPNGYELTAESALLCTQRLLDPSSKIAPGALTPSMAFGANFVLQLAGVSLETVD